MFGLVLKNLFKTNSTLVISRQTITKKQAAKKPWLTFAKGLLYAEIGLFIGCYLVWKRMNQSQEFRFYMKNNWPTILEGYYLNGEMLSNVDIRNFDKECWEKQSKQNK